MIKALSTPASGAVLLDANNTIIKIQSTNGAGYYFRALIYIDGVLFDQQSWSRIDGSTAVTDLKKLYNAYFDIQFNPAITTGIEQITNLKRQVSIVVNEYSIAGGAIVNTLTLPSFYLMFNIKPAAFKDTEGLTILDLDPAVMVIAPDGKIAIPFYISKTKASTETLSVSIETPLGVLYSRASFITAVKSVYLFNYDLKLASLAKSVTHLKVTIKFGTSSTSPVKTVVYRLNHLPDYPLKEIAFQNNFGFYLYAYLDGEMQVQDGFEVDTYETKNGENKVNQIDETASYTINSGSFNQREKGILNMIANSPDVRFNNGGTWLTMLPQTKKVNSFKDRQHIYGADLLFSLRKGNDVANTGFIEVLPNVADIVILSSSVNARDVTINYQFNNGFITTRFNIQYRTLNSTAWINAPAVAANPLKVKLSVGQYILRLADFNNMANVSNQINVTTV